MPVFKIQHITKYKYDRPVRESANQIKIFPYVKGGAEILSHELVISDEPVIHKYTDYWGNTVGYFTVTRPHQELIIDSRLLAKTNSIALDLSVSVIDDWAVLQTEVAQNLLLLDLTQTEKIASQQLILNYLNEIECPKISPVAAAQKCSTYVFDNFKYVKGITNVETTIDEILTFHSGVCQDFAHVLLQMLRTIGIPSRYVSGYICPNKNGMRGEGATHAWVEAYIPKLGWIGLDPTNNCFTGAHHVTLAVGRDFADCTPVKGTFKGPANHELMVFVSVGYEDGTVFEDENTVLMQKEQGSKPVAIVQTSQQQ